MEENKAQAASAALEAVLQAGMAYADFRKQVLAQGWTPVPDAQCRANVVGADHEAVCSQDSSLAACKVCEQMTELSACSGDGHCLVRFRHDANGESVEATGYGMVEDWNVPGEDSRLQLSKWSFSKDSAPESVALRHEGQRRLTRGGRPPPSGTRPRFRLMCDWTRLPLDTR